MAASNFDKRKEQFMHYHQVVKRAGNDQLQQDLIKLVQKKYLLTSEAEAIKILESYSSSIQHLITKYKKPVDVSPVPAVSAPSVSANVSVSHPPSANLLHKEFDLLPAARITDEDTTPILYGCHNVVTNLRTVMSGSVMQLYGLNLDINRSDTLQGLYLTDFSGNTTKITTIVRVKSTNIIFMIPGGLKANIYRLEIRKRASTDDNLLTCLLSGFIRVII